MEIKLHFVNNESLPKNINFKEFAKNKTKAIQNLKGLIQKLYLKGYIESSIDSVVENNNNLHSYIYIGNQYFLSKLENGNLKEEVLRSVHFEEEMFNNKEFSFTEIEKLEHEILTFYEKKGYPFTEVKLDSFYIENKGINTKIFAFPNTLFTIDTLIVEGNSKTTSNFLQNYLNIKNGDYYDKSKIDKINQKLAQLPFIKETKDALLVFLNGKIKLHIFVDKQNSNEFNFLLGIQPNNKLSERKITITGDGRLRLNNSFGVGEEIYIDFKQLRPQTQNIDIDFTYPYLLNLPIGVNGAFNLYKNDTSFLNLNTKVGIIYPFNGADFIQLFYQNQISNVLNFDTLGIQSNNKIPQTLDVENNNFGLKMHFQNLDYIFNPRKGYDFTISAAIGTRLIKKNTILTDLKADVYDNFNLESFSYNLDLEFKYFIPILKRHTFLMANTSKLIIAKDVLTNEKFRIGGAKTIRGFDEEEIFSPYFSIFTLEYHFSISKNAYFYTFGDVALVEDVRFKNNKLDIPFGIGVGATFETKAGLFSLSYAFGKQLDNKIELSNGKIHFGYINLF